MVRGGRRCDRVAAGLIAAVAAVVAATLVLVVPVTPVQAASTSVSMTAFASLAVDPASGRVFLSGDDQVVAFSPEGALLGTVTDVPGARGMAFTGGFLWVAQTSGGSIAKIDPATLAKVGELDAGGTILPSLIAVDGQLWYVGWSDTFTATLRSVDPATGTVTSRGFTQGTNLIAIPGSTTRLLAADTGLSPYSVYLYDLTTNPVTVLGDVPHGLGGNLGGTVATEVGTFVTASGAPYHFDEISTTPTDGLLHPTGVVYPGTTYPNGIAYTAARGGIFAGTTASSKKLWIARRGVPVSTHVISLPADPALNGVGLAPDGSRAYAVTRTSGGQLNLNTYGLAPTVTSTSVTSVPQERSSRVVVTGTGLGSITSVALGGAAVPFAHDGADRLELEVDTSVAVGSTTLALQGSFGDVDIPFTVTANPYATVQGVARLGGLPAGGASVRITDADGAVWATEADWSGTWSLPVVWNGSHVDVEVSSGTASFAWRDQTLQGAGPFTYDVDLTAPPARTLERRRYELPPGAVRRLVTDPATGLVFISVGDEVVVFDDDGRLVKRIHDQWSANDLQVVGTKLYVMLHRAGKVSEIDIPTLSVTRTIAVQRLNTGSFAVAGNRLFVADDDDQWTHIVAIDLTTGSITQATGSQAVPWLAPVEGEPQHFMSWQPGTSSGLAHWNASTPTVSAVATVDPSTSLAPGDVAASSTAGKVWTATGVELSLATLAPTGVTYPHGPTSAVARSAGHGGVLAFGNTVVRQGTAKATHLLPASPAFRSVGVDAAGDRTFTATTAGELVVSDLTPIVNVVGPTIVSSTPASLVVGGVGLGGVTGARIDDTPVPFTVSDTNVVKVTMPAVPNGLHQLTLESPWGTSSPVAVTVGVPWAPFASWTALVKRQYLDLTGAQPNSIVVGSWVSRLADGSATAGDLVEALRRGSDNTKNVDPVARLYRAFLGRTPDAGGLRFWVGRKRAGTWTVTKMADSFATSSEFTRTYGKLTNRAFVTRIYTDVLGRAADTSGVNYWTGTLDAKTRTRGQVMVGFSESSEYKRKQAENTDVAVAYVFLLGRSPSASEVTDWVDRQKSGTSAVTLAQELLDSPGYAAHVG